MEGQRTRKPKTLRHSEATQWPWNPPRRRTRPTVDAQTQTLRHSEGEARGILNPRLGREPSVADRVRKGGVRERAKLLPQGGSGAERTLRRRRGRAVRYRYPGGTNRGIPARSARMTCNFSTVVVTCTNQPGDSSVASLPLNDEVIFTRAPFRQQHAAPHLTHAQGYTPPRPACSLSAPRRSISAAR